MDFTKAIEEIIKDTNDNKIVWKNENPENYQKIVSNYHFAYKAYSCDYSKNEQSIQLLFVEKKALLEDEITESYYPELIVMNKSSVVGILDEHNSSRDDLIRLSGAIENNNEGMNNFVKMFEQGG